MRRINLSAGVLLASILWAGSAAAQDVERVRALYVAAAYEEALAAMPREAPAGVKVEVEQYRALCLLALGRESEAATVVEGIVRENPTYLPSATDVSPRMQGIFAAARVKLLPELARDSYASAKAAFDAKDGETARAAFRRTLAIVDSLPEADRGSLADLRLLAAEFLDLAATLAAPPPPAEKPASEPPPVALPYAGPAAIEEQLPPWNPPDAAAMRSEYIGVLRVHIGEDGRVSSAEIVKSSHPSYDVVVTRAARAWVYKPATRGGKPLPSVKDLQIRLVPR